MKKMKLKLTMIVTIIAIIMMNMAVYAATDMTTNVTTNNEGKKIVDVTVSLKEDNLTDADFTLEFKKDLFTFESSNVAENDLIKDNLADGKLKVTVDESFLKANNYSATFKFKYIGEEKTTAGTFKVIPTDFVVTEPNKLPHELTVNPITKDVTIKFEEEIVTPLPEETTKPEETPSPEETTKPEETAKPKETTKPEEGTKGEINLNDKKPGRIPQAGTNVVPYIAGGIAILMVAGLIIVNNKKNK